MAEQEQLNRLWHLISGKPVLVVLDNFPEGEDMEAWLPPEKSIFTLVTSRRKDFYGGFCHDLDRLADEEALALLNSGHRSFNMEEAQPLFQSLEGLPLALELVKHFLNIRKALSIKDLLEEMHALGQMEALKVFTEKYAHQLPTGHSKEVAATFGMGWDLASDFEKEVLKAISLLAPVPFPRRVLRKVLKRYSKSFLRVVQRFFKKLFASSSESKLSDPLDEGVSRLDTSLSMVELDEEKDPRMHRLIAAFVQTLIYKDDALHQQVITSVMEEMARVEDDKDIKSFRELEKVLPHADFLLSSRYIKPKQALDTANGTAKHHWKLGRYRLAEKYCVKALNIALTNYKPGDPEIATQQSNLALVLQALGQLEEARDLLRAVLESTKNTFEPGHPKIAISQSNLAGVLHDLGQLEEARDLFRAALESDQKTFEPGHPSIAGSQSNLALVLKDLGQLEEARDLLRTALETCEKNLEPGHPNIATVQSNLALVLQDLGQLDQLEEARDLFRAALESNQKTFEPGHPSIAISESNLAAVLQDLGKLEAARDLLQAALESDQKTFEPGHPSIAIRQSNLATVLHNLGQLQEAKELVHQAYHTLLEKLGSEHYLTKRVKENLDLIVKGKGKKRS
jgi:tetratricopeptide (TPR) repeat protein